MLRVELSCNKSAYQACFSYSYIAYDNKFYRVIVSVYWLHHYYFNTFLYYISIMILKMCLTQVYNVTAKLEQYYRIIQSQIQRQPKVQYKPQRSQQMQVQQLTENGIERLFKGEAVVVQIFNCSRTTIVKKDNQMELIIATISDGFAYYEAVYLFPYNFTVQKEEFCVVKLKLSQGIIKKIANGSKPNGILLTNSAEFYFVTNKVQCQIGNPMKYQDFIKNGKRNTKGNRKIFSASEIDDDTDDDFAKQASIALNKKKPKKQQMHQMTKIKKQPQSRQASTSRNKSVTNTNQSNTNQQKTIQPQKPKPAPATKSIIKIQEKQQSRRDSIKPQVKHHEGDHEKIKQLFLGLQNFKVIARLLFIWPIRNITNKKGVQSELLNLEFGDETGTIMCTVFGDNAGKYKGLEVDKIYSITGAVITDTTYKGVHELKLTFNDGTKVAIETIQKSKIPSIQKFCLSLKQLSEVQKGRVVSVYCMAKQGELVEFVSKNGNNIKKKTIKLYDLDNQVQCDLTLFNDKAQAKYQAGMHAFKGVQVDQFQGNKQFKASLTFVARKINPHKNKEQQMNKLIKNIDDMNFQPLLGPPKKPKGTSLSSFYALNEKCQQLNMGQSIWTQTLCYLKAVRLGSTTKNVYLSCPHCKKKILDQSATSCDHCKKDFDKPKYRYILSVNLMDDHDNIWVSVYDQPGQKILNLPSQQILSAESFAEMTQQVLKHRIQQIRYKQLKVKIVSAKQTYNNQVRVKHKLNKVLPISYQEQIKGLLQRVKFASTM